MARAKRTSSIITDAETRAAGLAAIDAALNLGDGRTLAAFQAQIDDAKAKLTRYNSTLAQADAEQNALEVAEDTLAQAASQYLKAVALKFGDDSDEYEKAGGTRTSERKKPGRRPGGNNKPNPPA